MARIRNQLVRLGIFVVSVVAVLVLSLVLIGGLRVRKSFDTYHVVTSRAVLGIELDSPVTLRGVEIGRVAAIELDRSDFGRVRIDLAIDPSIGLPAASKAYFQRVGMTGQRVIDITGGTLAEGRLPPGSDIPHEETPLDALEAEATGFGDELSTIIAEARETVDRAKRVVAAIDPERLAAIVEAVDPARVEAIVVHTERTVEALESTSEELGRAVTEGRAHVEIMAQDVEAVAEQAATVLEHADDASRELSRVLVVAATILSANQDDVRAAIRDLRSGSRDARALARALRTRPSLLRRSAPPKERKLP